MNVKRISSGVYEVAVVGGLMTPAEHEKLYKQATERLNWEIYEPTSRELTVERYLQAWCGMMRPWQAQQTIEGFEKSNKKATDRTAEYHPLERVPNGR